MIIKGRPHPNHKHPYAEYQGSQLHKTSTNGCNRIEMNGFSAPHSSIYKVIYAKNQEETSEVNTIINGLNNIYI